MKTDERNFSVTACIRRGYFKIKIITLEHTDKAIMYEMNGLIRESFQIKPGPSFTLFGTQLTHDNLSLMNKPYYNEVFRYLHKEDNPN